MGSKLKYLFTVSASIPVSRSCFKFLLWFLPVVDCALSDVSWNKHFLPQVALVMVFYDSSKNPRICPIRISRIGKMNHLNSKARLRKGDIPGRHASEREVIYKNFPVKPFLFFFFSEFLLRSRTFSIPHFSVSFGSMSRSYTCYPLHWTPLWREELTNVKTEKNNKKKFMSSTKIRDTEEGSGIWVN